MLHGFLRTTGKKQDDHPQADKPYPGSLRIERHALFRNDWSVVTICKLIVGLPKLSQMGFKCQLPFGDVLDDVDHLDL